MRQVFDSLEEARLACRRENTKPGRKKGEPRSRPLSVYRVFQKGKPDRYVVALAPKEAVGASADYFDLYVELCETEEEASSKEKNLKDMNEAELEQHFADVQRRLKEMKRQRHR